MTFLPVAVRELRAEARNPLNYWMRVATAAVAILIFFAVSVGATANGAGPASAGRDLLSCLNSLTLFVICLLAPMLTADCLSREKREGTLGLLFLTPLTAGGVVVAKGLIHGLRSLSLLLVAMPLFALVFLLGGVGWQQVVIALLLNLNALALGLGAGILASAWSRARAGAMVLALLIFSCAMAACLFFLLGAYIGQAKVSFPQLWQWPLAVFYLCTRIGNLGTAAQWDNLLWATAESSLLALIIGGGVLWLAAVRVNGGWQDKPLTERQIRSHKFFLSARFLKSLFRRRMSRALDVNPVGWLQQYSWSARMVKWGWCLVFLVMQTWLVIFDFDALADGQIWMAFLLLLGVSFSAANSFIRERRSGAMELILVTPLPLEQITFGRIKGIWWQFLPAVGILALSIGFTAMYRQTRDPTPALFCILSFLLLPQIGIYFSLRQKSFFSAWMLTCCVGFLLPFIGGFFVSLGLGLFRMVFYSWWRGLTLGDLIEIGLSKDGPFWAAAVIFEIVCGVKAWRLLTRTLENRTFAVNLS